MVKTDNTAYQALVLVWLWCGNTLHFKVSLALLSVTSFPQTITFSLRNIANNQVYIHSLWMLFPILTDIFLSWNTYSKTSHYLDGHLQKLILSCFSGLFMDTCHLSLQTYFNFNFISYHEGHESRVDWNSVNCFEVFGILNTSSAENSFGWPSCIFRITFLTTHKPNLL